LKTVLHVGCGQPNPAKLHATFRSAEWKELRLDIDPAVNPDIVASITDFKSVADGSIDAVWSSHNLEHLYAHEVPLALEEFRRVLKPDGFALITLPDLQKAAALIAADKLDEPAYVSAAGPVAPLDMLFGYRPLLAQGRLFMAHRTGFTRKTLGQALINAGFKLVRAWTDDAFGLWAAAYKNPSPETLQKARAAIDAQQAAPTQPVDMPEAQPSGRPAPKKRPARGKRRR
jgi:SAM-dependent methyltransferase